MALRRALPINRSNHDIKSYILILILRPRLRLLYSEWIILKAHKWTWAKSIFLLDFTIFVIFFQCAKRIASISPIIIRCRFIRIVWHRIHGLARYIHAFTLKIILLWTVVELNILQDIFFFLFVSSLFFGIWFCSAQSVDVNIWYEKGCIFADEVWKSDIRKNASVTL